MATLGIIDFGSNSLKVSVFDGQQKEIARTSESVRIFKAEGERVVIAPDVMQAAVEAIQRLKNFAQQKGATQIYILGTSAVRDCENRQQLLETLTQQTGLKMMVISGEVEARLVAQAVKKDPAYAHYQNILAFDLGGGSLEVVRVQYQQCTLAKSFPLGVVRLMHDFMAHPHLALGSEGERKIKNHLYAALKPVLSADLADNHLIVGAGGAFSIIALYLEAMGESPVGGRLPLLRIRELKDKMLNLPLAERSQIAGIPKDRADIMPISLVVLDVLAELTGAEAFYLTHRGVRHGMVDLIQQGIL